ncbi:hypothetical protein H6G08_02560 [Calothrix anomala FACHB-343]|uniref:Thioredoxin domain-containing protein n=3 Tax=Calotrichaceae TaxID=2661849 RepID=A0ABR8A3K2_9CYAN|nr:hypothetical protein [Calothrix parietina FACHB-288]MBD2223386.1 hypothetical protein [Calothrix anomala FACHB-343]
MKNIAKIGRRLISMFLLVLVSSLMFLPSPALAADWVKVNRDNFYSTVLHSDNTVILLMLPSLYTEYDDGMFQEQVANIKSEVEKAYGDKYTLAISSDRENPEIYYSIPAPRIFPPFPVITAFKHGERLFGTFISPDSPTVAIERINDQIANS